VATISSNALCMDDFILKFDTISRNACHTREKVLTCPTTLVLEAPVSSAGMVSREKHKHVLLSLVSYSFLMIHGLLIKFLKLASSFLNLTSIVLTFLHGDDNHFAYKCPLGCTSDHGDRYRSSSVGLIWDSPWPAFSSSAIIATYRTNCNMHEVHCTWL